MALTTQTIIKTLPFDKDFKSQLLADWDTLDPEQKFTLELMLWDAYDDIYNLKLKANLDEAMLAVADKKADFDETFYQQIKDKTEQEMQKEGSEEASSADLSETRKELEKILTQQKS